MQTQVVRSSELKLESTKSDLILDLCRHFSAVNYLSGALGRDYLIEDDFKKFGISIDYQKFATKTYPQLWGNFIPNLSILDWWMNATNDFFSKGKP